jgi:hypothetical protein
MFFAAESINCPPATARSTFEFSFQIRSTSLATVPERVLCKRIQFSSQNLFLAPASGLKLVADVQPQS